MLFRRRHLRRYRQIVTTLMRHGFGWLVAQFGLSPVVPFHRGFLGHARRDEPYSPPEHLRFAFEELGTTFIKLAQILSTRPELISPAYAEEFAKLQDAVPPVSVELIQQRIEEEFGRPVTDMFSEFDPEPVGSASIGQVHRARLHSGEGVVVKVQRPGVRETVAEDLAILRQIARMASQRTEWGRYYDLEGQVEEFAFTLENELDYTREGQNADRFRQNFEDEPKLYIPKVYWELTTKGVITLEEIQGVKINDLAGLERAGVDRQRLAKKAVEILFREVFEHGFFHADPHPGNFVVMDDEVIGLMDFGMVGYLDRPTKDAFLRVAYAMTRGDADRLVDAMIMLGIAGGHVRREALKRDFDHLIFRIRGRPLSELVAAEMVREVMTVAFRHHLRLPSNLSMLMKVISMSEGLGASLDPDFRLFEFAAPFMRRYWLSVRSPLRLGARFVEELVDQADLAVGMPRRLTRLVAALERGELDMSVHSDELGRGLQRVQGSIDRLTISVLVGSLMLGAGFLVVTSHLMAFGEHTAWVFVALFLVSVGIAAVLLYAMWRSRRL
jgi:ubiquinone biosynthesis protein